MTHWYSIEEWHHIYLYPFLKCLLTLEDEPCDKLFFCHWFVPPGLRLEKYCSKEPLSACQSSESWFHSVEAFTYQLRYAAVPDPGYSISTLSEFLYRLLLCCLPTTNGGFTADALLLNNGILVNTWAKCIRHLTETIDERLLLLFGTDFPKHSVRDAMRDDLLYSVLQVIGWNVYHIHKIRHTPCYHFFPTPPNNDIRLFAKKVKPLLYKLNTLSNDQTLNDLTQSNNFIENSTTGSPVQKILHFSSINDDEWPSISLSNKKRPPAHLLRLIAALQLSFFSDFTENSSELCDVLVPWVELCSILTIELGMSYLKDGSPETVGMTDHSHIHPNSSCDMEVEFVIGLLIEAFRGILSLCSLGAFIFSNTILCQRLMSVLESICRLQLCPLPKNLSGPIILVLRGKQLQVLHQLVFSVFVKIQSISPNMFISQFYEALDLLFACNPLQFHSSNDNVNALKKIGQTSSFPCIMSSPTWSHVIDTMFPKDLPDYQDNWNHNTIHQFSLVFQNLISPIIQNSHYFSQTTQPLPPYILNPHEILSQLQEGRILTLSVLTIFLSKKSPGSLPILRELPIIKDSSLVTMSDILSINLCLVLYHYHLVQCLQPPFHLQATVLKFLCTQFANNPSFEKKVYYTHILSASFSSNLVSTGIFESINIDLDNLLNTAIETLRDLFQNLNLKNKQKNILFPSLIFLRLLARFITKLTLYMTRIRMHQNKAPSAMLRIPDLIFDVLHKLSSICKFIIHEEASTQSNSVFNASIASVLVMDCIVPILNQLVPNILKGLESIVKSQLFVANATLDTLDPVLFKQLLVNKQGISLDPISLLQQCFSKENRKILVDKLWDSLHILFNCSRFNHCQNLSTLLMSIIKPLFFLTILLDAEDVQATFLLLPSTCTKKIKTHSDINIVDYDLCPLEVSVDDASFVYENAMLQDINSFHVWWFENQNKIYSTADHLEWKCNHCNGESKNQINCSSDLCTYLKKVLITSNKKCHTANSNDTQCSLKQSHDMYWRQVSGDFCTICNLPIPEAETLGYYESSSFLKDRYNSLPSPIRLAAILTGSSPQNIIIREQNFVNVCLSKENLMRFMNLIVSCTSSVELGIQLTNGWNVSQTIATNANVDLLSEILSLCFVLGGPNILSFNTILLPLVHFCINNNVYWNMRNDMLRPTSISTSPSKDFLSGRQTLLHILESFRYISLLFGLPAIDKKKQLYFNTLSPLPNLQYKSRTLVLGHGKSLLSFISYTQYAHLPEFSVLCSEEIFHPTILILRRLLDWCRLILVCPTMSSSDCVTSKSENFLSSICTTFEACKSKLLLYLTLNGADDTQLLFGNYSITQAEDLQDLLRVINECCENLAFPPKCERESGYLSWIPYQDFLGFLCRGFTPHFFSRIICYWIGALRRSMRVQNTQDVILFLNILLRTANALGFHSFPHLLSQLDTKPLLTLLATSNTPEPYHIPFLLWMYSVSKKQTTSWQLLKSHLICIAYHPYGRRTLQKLESISGTIISSEERGFILVTNCSCWLSRCVPKFGSERGCFKERLSETWDVVIKQLFPPSEFKENLTNESDDVEKSKDMLRASLEVQLLLRELWDATSPLTTLHCQTLQSDKDVESTVFFLQNRLVSIKIKQDSGTLEFNKNGKLQLTTDAFLQVWEMLRSLWKERNDTCYDLSDSNDHIITKTLRTLEPSSVYWVNTCQALDGGALKRSVQFFSNPTYQKVISWRVCRVVKVFLSLLVENCINLYGVNTCFNGNPLDQHMTLIETLLTSLSDVSPYLAMCDCWEILIKHASPNALHPFLPTIVRKLLKLIDKLEEQFREHVILLLTSILTLMQKCEMESNKPILSVFCEVDILNSVPELSHELIRFCDNSEKLAKTILCNAGTILNSPNSCLEVKYAILVAIEIAFKRLNCTSLPHLHQLANVTFPSDYGKGFLTACVSLAGTTQPEEDPINLLAASILGLCGTHYTTMACSTLAPDWIWWDSCTHFIAVRVLEYLIYPNVNNRVSLYYIQELLQYLDNCIIENHDLYNKNPSNCCMYHDNPTTNVSVMDFVSDNVKRLGLGFKSSRYTLSVSDQTSQTLHPLQRFVKQLLQYIPSEHRGVFLRSGLEYSGFLPDVLKFLLPHLLLFTLTHLPEHNEEIAIRIGKTVVHILDLATMYSEASTTSVGASDGMFVLFDPTTTCQILFSAIDNLAQLIHVYSKIDVETHSNLEMQSYKDPQLRQSMSLSLPAHAWIYLQLVLRVCRGSNAAVAACKIGAFSRCLFYLESTLFSKGVTSSVVDTMMNLPKELGNYTSTFVPIFIDAFRGLQDWENIRGCLEAVTIPKDKDIFIDRLALTLESQNEPMVIAWEYTRLSRMNHVKSDDFRSKALHSFLDARDINTFLLEYEKSSGTVKAACLPLFMKSLWKQGLWSVLEYLYLKYSGTIRISTCLANSNELLTKEATSQRTTMSQNKYYPCIEYDIPPSIIDLPSPSEIVLAASTWSMQDRLDFLIAGVLSAVHQKDFTLTHSRLERFSKNAAASLATTTRETYFRSHLTLLPLQLSTDLKQFIQIAQDENISEEFLMERVRVVVNSSPPLIEVLDTMKVVLEELNCLRTAAMVSIRLSKILRKTIFYSSHTSHFNPVTLCGKYQLTDYLRFFDNTSNDDLLIRALRTELSKCVPSSMRLGLLEPLTTIDDKIAVRYAKLSVSTTHLLPEKLQMLQKVVEQHPQSEKAHRCLAELLDTQIYDWSSRTFKPSQKIHYLDSDCPQSALDDLPNFPKGWSMISLVESAIYHHLEAAAWSKSTQRARFHLLKFLQLLVDIFFREKTTNKNPDFSSVANGTNMNHATVQKIFIQKIFTLIEEPFGRIPISYWYLEVSQLVARCQHKQLGPKIFQPLLARLLQHMPQKMAWHLGPWFCSERSERHVTANNVLKAARELEDNGSSSLLDFYVERTATFISCLVSLASATLTPVSQQQESPSKNKVKLSKELPELARILSSVIVANGSTNAILLPLLSQLDASEKSLNSSCTFVHHIDDTMLIMRSKQRPKKLLFKGSDGFDYPWLVKKESRGDLRKDARLMEVAGYVNEWMEKVEKIKEKNLKIQRYSVIPLNEITGLIEWLPHLVTLRCAVLELLETHLGQDKFMNFMKKVISRYNRHKQNPSALFADFQETLKIFKPVLQEFFFERYGINVAVWYECRKTYCESLASWSVLGYVFGLGDRHGENILINIKTGQIVHVDFDCLFEKGLKLPVPEIVPFRLTQNLIAGLGFGGLKGGFLSACVDTLITLKEYQTDFLSLLQSFVFDPLIEWTRVGKNDYSQQEEDYEGGGLRATKYLQDVKIKLIGGLNCRSQKLLKPSSTLCAAGSQKSQHNSQLKVEEIYNYVTTWVVEPNITVETQVKELMEAASCQRNLSLMYLGWMPWV